MAYKDPAKEREYQRLYRAANREKRLERERLYRAANPEKVRERDRLYRAANPEREREKCRLYARKERQIRTTLQSITLVNKLASGQIAIPKNPKKKA